MERKSVVLTIVTVLLMAAASTSFAVMSVNFPGDLSVSGSLGAPDYQAENWLNTNTQPDSWGTTYNLQDETGTPTGAVLSMWASGFGAQLTWVTNEFPIESQMLETGIGSWDPADPPTFQVDNIPYGKYHVVVYFGARMTYDAVQQVVVNGSALYGRIAANTGYTEMGFLQIPDTSTTDQQAATPVGNYMVFENVTGSTLNVSALPAWHDTAGDARAFISGFQIIPVYQKSMAVNFPAGEDITGVVGAPGYAQANWLNTVNQPDSWGTTYDLQDESGTPTGAVLSVWASAFGDQQGFSSSPLDAQMLERGIGTYTDGVTYTPYDPATFTVTDIPYAEYAVVVYFGSRHNDYYVQTITANGQTRYAQTPANTGYAEMGYRLVPDTSTANLEQNTPYGNYVVFTGLTDTDITVEAGWAGGTGPLPRAFISGFQIVCIQEELPPKQSLAVNFPGSLTVTGKLGAPGYEQDNWLNTTTDPDSWGTTYDLQDESATPTGAILAFWASGFGAQETYVNTDFPMPSRMLETAIGAYEASDPATFRVEDIPYPSYDAVIYFGTRRSYDFVQQVVVNGTSRFAKIPTYTGYTEMGYRLVPDSSTASYDANTPYGNYMVFEGLTDPTLTVTALPDWHDSAGDARAYISGFQIVNACLGGSSPGDLSGDCQVNLVDMAMLASDWLIDVDTVPGIRSGCANNPLLYAPAISAITVDGDFSDWTAASDWAQFGKWYEGGNATTTKAKYAWNDTADKLYIAVESTEVTDPILEIGALMGNLPTISNDPNALPSSGVKATQIEFADWQSGTATVTNQSSGTTAGIEVAYIIDGGTIKIEIATPIYSDWTQSSTAMDLTPGMDIYEYADLFSADWVTGDHQCADGEYYYSYSSQPMTSATLIRLVNAVPRVCEDIPDVYKNGVPANFNGDCLINVSDFAQFGTYWPAQ